MIRTTQNFRQKKIDKETRSNVCNYFAYNKEENSSRCLVQGQKQCGKILNRKLATNLKKQNKHKKEFEECDTAEKARGANSTEQEDRARHLHHNLTINQPHYYT